MKEVSRRTFLATTGVAGLAAAAGALTACTPSGGSNGASSGVESAPKNEFIDKVCAGYDVYSASAFEPEPISDDAVAETIEADVVIVGAGIGGAIAAATTIENGQTCIVLQKEATPLSHGWGIAACKTKAQIDAEYEVDWPAALNEWRRAGENRDDYDLTNTWLKYSGETVDWLFGLTNDVDGVGPMIAPPNMKATYDTPWTNTYATAHGWMGEMKALATWLIDYAVKGGAQVRYRTPAVQLVTNEGAVKGVIGKDADGNYVKCIGTVIMSAGDYGHNPGLRAKYMPHIEGLPSAYSVETNTGDGQLMMMAIGGQMQLPPHAGNIHYDPPVGVPNLPGSGIPFLSVNMLGNRFTNEDVNYGQLYAQDMLQPEKIHFQVFDSTYPDYYANMGHGMMRDEPNSDYSGIAKGIETGDVLSGNTIQELAEKMGVDAGNLEATIARYNELCDLEVDEDYGKAAMYLHKIDTPPYLAMKRQAGLLCSLNGVVTNEDMQALDNDGKVIEGLYVTGNCQGNWFGGLEHPMCIPGMSLGRAALTARVAAMRACGAEY